MLQAKRRIRRRRKKGRRGGGGGGGSVSGDCVNEQYHQHLPERQWATGDDNDGKREDGASPTAPMIMMTTATKKEKEAEDDGNDGAGRIPLQEREEENKIA